MFENIKVVKRDGKKVDFDGSKIALAIKKGFDSVALDEEEAKYSEKDINKVYNLVIEEIGNLGVERRNTCSKKDMKMYILHFRSIGKEELSQEKYFLKKRNNTSF